MRRFLVLREALSDIQSGHTTHNHGMNTQPTYPLGKSGCRHCSQPAEIPTHLSNPLPSKEVRTRRYKSQSGLRPPALPSHFEARVAPAALLVAGLNGNECASQTNRLGAMGRQEAQFTASAHLPCEAARKFEKMCGQPAVISVFWVFLSPFELKTPVSLPP